MPVYEYFCTANNTSVEVEHAFGRTLRTWGELCAETGIDLGGTPPDAALERLLFVPYVTSPTGDSQLKNLGFTKLVKRDTGVYENVTATGKDSRYMKAGDASTVPNLKGKIRD